MIELDDMLSLLSLEKIQDVIDILGLPKMPINATSSGVMIKSKIFPAYTRASPDIQEKIEMILNVGGTTPGKIDPIVPVQTDKMTVESVDSFVRQFQITDYTDKKQIKALNDLISSSSKIGSGGVGTVFSIPGTDYVVKKTDVCDRPMTNLCNMAISGDVVYKIPFTPSNKTVVMAPNYVSETIVGLLLSKQSPSFVDINRFYFDTSEYDSTIVFIIMEKLEPNILPMLTGLNEIKYLTLQVFQALSVAQSKFSFVHGDLHLGNVLPRKHTGTKNIKCYEVGNGKFLYTYFDYDNVITDFGFSRCETDNSILIPRMDIDKKASDNFAFNPYVDIFTFLTFLCFKSGYIHNPRFPPEPSLETHDIQDYITGLLKVFFGGMTIDEEFIKSNIVETGGQLGWRADAAKLYKNARTRLSNASDMFNYVANMIETKQLVVSLPDLNYEVEVVSWLTKNKFYVANKPLRFFENPVQLVDRVLTHGNPYFSRVELTAAKDTTVDDLINVCYYDTFDSPRYTRHDYNLVVTPSITDGSRTFSDQNIYVAKFNQNAALKRGYSYRFDCCNVDPRDYLKMVKFDSGIVVNSVFFDIHGDKTPIGYYKTKDILIDNPIPSLYKQYYSFIGINQHGKLEFSIDNKQAYEQVLACGATIIKDGNPCFTEANITQTGSGNRGTQFLFLSGKQDKVAITATINNITAKLLNVDFIEPGQLLHAGNPNPRTILGLSADGDTVYFIRIEGRDNRGVGMDFVQMGMLCKSLGIYNALNLDGGRSSQMCWKNPGDNTVYVSGTSLESYPVGGVISLVKQR